MDTGGGAEWHSGPEHPDQGAAAPPANEAQAAPATVALALPSNKRTIHELADHMPIAAAGFAASAQLAVEKIKDSRASRRRAAPAYFVADHKLDADINRAIRMSMGCGGEQVAAPPTPQLLQEPFSASSSSSSSSSAATPPPSSFELKTAFAVGDRIECRFGGGRHFFPGQVVAMHGDGAYGITYDDGDYEAKVRARPWDATGHGITSHL